MSDLFDQTMRETLADHLTDDQIGEVTEQWKNLSSNPTLLLVRNVMRRQSLGIQAHSPLTMWVNDDMVMYQRGRPDGQGVCRESLELIWEKNPDVDPMAGAQLNLEEDEGVSRAAAQGDICEESMDTCLLHPASERVSICLTTNPGSIGGIQLESIVSYRDTGSMLDYIPGPEASSYLLYRTALLRMKRMMELIDFFRAEATNPDRLREEINAGLWYGYDPDNLMDEINGNLLNRGLSELVYAYDASREVPEATFPPRTYKWLINFHAWVKEQYHYEEQQLADGLVRKEFLSGTLFDRIPAVSIATGTDGILFRFEAFDRQYQVRLMENGAILTQDTTSLGIITDHDQIHPLIDMVRQSMHIASTILARLSVQSDRGLSRACQPAFRVRRTPRRKARVVAVNQSADVAKAFPQVEREQRRRERQIWFND